MNAEPTTRAAQDLPGWTTIVDADGEPVALVRDKDLAGELLQTMLRPVPATGDARRCGSCGQLSRVVDSRSQQRSGSVRRRRRCDACRVSWTTFETRARPAHSDDA